MQILIVAGVLLASYLIGSIPFGLIVVKLTTGKDIRAIESGRTGGTNAMRAGGFWVGFSTAILDILKGAMTVWLARWAGGGAWPWLEILAPIMAILGHNYSVFLPITENGRLVRFSGGAGGAPSLGGAFGLWWPSILIIFPLGFLIFFGVGYASVTTMSVAFLAIIIFTLRFFLVGSPWQYIIFGVVAELLLMWALRPNIKRLLAGTERLHGWRAKRSENQEQNS
ncbi:MAG: glycerol-3-phosphate acyltransferase [Chloroflexota bacterium]